MKKWKQRIATVLVLAMLVTLMPVGTVEAKSKSPAKLGAKDFVYTFDGKKVNFVSQSKMMGNNYFLCSKDADVKSSAKSSLKTNRKVKLGSTESYVKKQYGKTAKVKVNNKERLYKYIKYDKYNNPTADISVWKNYLEYNYKKGSDNYKLRFYLDKKNKVSAIAYVKNLDKYYNYPNKELNPGLTFQAPKGKKITTKTINHKKVYIVPKGTKISFKKGAVSKTVFNRMSTKIDMYDLYGTKTAWYKEMYIPDSSGNRIKQGKNYDLYTIMDGHMWTIAADDLNMEELGEYLYFAMTFDDSRGGVRSKAPSTYYFKFQ